MSRRLPPVFPPGEAGFTLLELVIALVILAMAFVAVAGLGRPGSPRVRAEAAAEQVASTLRLARAAAITRRAPVFVTIDIGRNVIATSSGEQALDQDLRLSLLAADREVVSRELARVRFDSDGSSSGGRVGIAAGEVLVWVGVDWLTGKVSIVGAR